MDINIDNPCGCGKPVRYTTLCGKGSCNKYMRCPSYGELEEEVNNLRKLLLIYRPALKKIMDSEAEGYEYRSWAKAALDHKNAGELVKYAGVSDGYS